MVIPSPSCHLRYVRRTQGGTPRSRGAADNLHLQTPAASLNISTYVNLATYGYTNVYELGPLTNVKTSKLPFEGEEVSR